MRHAKRCTLEPTPSARQKACKNCITAKSRCDLQRPACSRCESRGIPCAYVRPVRTVGRREDVPTVSSGSVVDANSGLRCQHSLVGTHLGNLRTEARVGAGVGVEEQAMTRAAADEIVSAYLSCEAEFMSLPGSRKAVHACLGAGLLPSDSVGASDDMMRSEPGFDAAYSTSSRSTNGIHTTPHTHSHHSAGFCAGGLDVRLDLDSGNSGVDIDLPVTCNSMHTNFTNVRLPSDGVDSFSIFPPTMATATSTPDSEEFEVWMRTKASKPVIPLSVPNHRGMQIIMSSFLFHPAPQLPCLSEELREWGSGAI